MKFEINFNYLTTLKNELLLSEIAFNQDQDLKI